jgi:hypothetical protein
VLWADEAFLEKPFTSDAVLEAMSLLLSGHIGPLNRVTVFPKPRPPADR